MRPYHICMKVAFIYRFPSVRQKVFDFKEVANLGLATLVIYHMIGVN